MLSRTADHALRAVLYLARHEDDGPIAASRIAAALGAPANYLSRTLRVLAREGVVEASRGAAGGFRLRVPAPELRLTRVIEPFDDTARRTVCLLGDRPCDGESPCAAHRMWTAVVDDSRAPLRGTTVADLLDGAENPDPRALRRERNRIMTKKLMFVLMVVLAVLVLTAARETDAPPSDVRVEVPSIPTPVLPELRGEEVAVLTDAPLVPPPITRDHATRLKVELETVELKKRLADGVEYTFWTFGGSVPGKFIRVRQGDLVEFTLKNHPMSSVAHNIDLHAVTGPGGGAKASFTGPGQETRFEFRALNPGLYVYHCAVAPVGMHIANGMYGLILVEPEEGLPEVDREFYVMQGEFYTAGRHGEPGHQPFDYEKALDEKPEYVVFNGSVGSMTGEASLKANTGETIRLFVGNGGPNLVSSFHVVGEIFDNVYYEGGTRVQNNVQTTLVPAGGSAVTEFRADVPGTFIMVDHSIFRAFDKGALGMIDVTGEGAIAAFDGQPAAGAPAEH